MPLDFTDKSKKKPAGKINQPGSVNAGLKNSRNKQGKNGSQSTIQGKANLSGEMQPQNKDEGFFTGIARSLGEHKRDTQRSNVARAKQWERRKRRFGTDVEGMKAAFAGEETLGRPEAIRRADVSREAGTLDDYGFDAYDAEFGDLPGAFNRDVSAQPTTPPIGAGYSEVANAPGAFKRTFARDDGTTGTEYTNMPEGGAPAGVTSLGGVGAGSAVGPNYAQSEELSQINADISNLLRGDQREPEVSFEQLMAYNNAKDVKFQNNREKVRLRHELSRGGISGRRYAEAIGRIDDKSLAAQELATGYTSKPSEMLQARASMRQAGALEQQAGSKAGAGKYSADVSRQTKLDELFGADVISARETAGGMNEATMGAIGKMLSSPDGIAAIDKMGGIENFIRSIGLGGGGGSRRSELDSFRKEQG